MLSNHEKKEMLADAKSLKRRKAFARAKFFRPDEKPSLDKFLRFLKGLQKVTAPFALSHKATLSRMNKL